MATLPSKAQACSRSCLICAIGGILLLAAESQGCSLVSSQTAGQFRVLDLASCNDPYQLGRTVGKATADLILSRFKDSKALADVKGFVASGAGAAVFQQFKQLHQASFPGAWQELQGLAAGAGVQLDEVLIMNLRQELLAAWHSSRGRGSWLAPEDACTDVILVRPEQQQALQPQSYEGQQQQQQQGMSQHHHHRRLHLDSSKPGRLEKQHGPPWPSSPGSAAGAGVGGGRAAGRGAAVVLGHNEDMTLDTLGRVFFLRHVGASPGDTWFAFVYAGELPSSGFGGNAAGLSFSLNAVFPSRPLLPGVGRNFVSHQLLRAGSIGEAIAIISRHGQSVGHSYNLLDLPRGAALQVEVGPGGAASALALSPGPSWYFHANAYKHLVVEQLVDDSSYHREVRALALQAPKDLAGVLNILGDTGDPLFPIYRQGDQQLNTTVLTLCTAVWDSAAAALTVLAGNPRDSHQLLRLDLSTWQLQIAAARAT